MLYNDEVLYIHVPKTAGMSITAYLLNNLKGQIYLTHKPLGGGWKQKNIKFPDVEERVHFLKGRRHARLDDAVAFLEPRGIQLADFKIIFALIRNPYDLQVSHFSHMRKPNISDRYRRNSPGVVHAYNDDFEKFAETVPFYSKEHTPISRFYQLGGTPPANMHLIRFESMATELPALLAPCSLGRFELPHLNISPGRSTYHELLTPTAEKAIYRKFEHLFKYYPREERV